MKKFDEIKVQTYEKTTFTLLEYINFVYSFVIYLQKDVMMLPFSN